MPGFKLSRNAEGDWEVIFILPGKLELTEEMGMSALFQYIRQYSMDSRTETEFDLEMEISILETMPEIQEQSFRDIDLIKFYRTISPDSEIQISDMTELSGLSLGIPEELMCLKRILNYGVTLGLISTISEVFNLSRFEFLGLAAATKCGRIDTDSVLDKIVQTSSLAQRIQIPLSEIETRLAQASFEDLAFPDGRPGNVLGRKRYFSIISILFMHSGLRPLGMNTGVNTYAKIRLAVKQYLWQNGVENFEQFPVLWS